MYNITICSNVIHKIHSAQISQKQNEHNICIAWKQCAFLFNAIVCWVVSNFPYKKREPPLKMKISWPSPNFCGFWDYGLECPIRPPRSSLDEQTNYLTDEQQAPKVTWKCVKKVEISESENTASKKCLRLAFKNGNRQWMRQTPKKCNWQPPLKLKISWPPCIIQNFQTGVHYDYHWLYGNLCTWDTMYRVFLLFSVLSYLAEHYHFLVQ